MFQKITSFLLGNKRNTEQSYIEPSHEYNNTPFVIISNNCWGAEIYKKLNLEFNTPFVGLYIYSPDYVRLLENFDSLIKHELRFTEKSKFTNAEIQYPIGLLDDIEIHFMHYDNRTDAKDKWERRLSRMLGIKEKNSYYFKICDRDNSSIEIFKRFHDLPFQNKISFAVFDFKNDSHITVEESEDNKFVVDGLKLFNITNKYTDIIHWINTGKVIKK